jgi:hypothetical protein
MKLLIICPATRQKGGVFQFSLSCLSDLDTSSNDTYFLVSNDFSSFLNSPNVSLLTGNLFIDLFRIQF